MRTINKIYSLLERIDTQYRDYTLLTESQESKSISAAKKLVMQKLGWDEQRADKFVREQLRGDLPALRTRNGGKFILGVTRMFCGGQLSDGGIIMRLNSTLELVASDAHINEYDRNLNGMSAQELIDRFSGAMKEIGDKDREEVAALELQENNDYTIVQIDNFDQSSQYGKYTSWCVTHSPSMLDSYTSNGIGQFYFCLKNGFENVPAEPGEGCPLDEYGLSMIAVSVDGGGNLNTCTCRWNHANGGNDNIMNTKQISQLIGRNFYEVFKPNNKWKNAIETAMQRLENGENPSDIFDDCFRVRNEDEGYCEILLLSKWNYLNPEGKVLSPNLWFDGIYAFRNGLGLVHINWKYNFVNANGEIISPNLWFDNGGGFDTNIDLGKVMLDNKFNVINRNGEILLEKWVDNIRTTTNGPFSVRVGHKYNYVSGNGQFLSPDMWFDDVYDFHHGLAPVRLDGKWNFIGLNGQLLSPNKWFDDLYADFGGGNEYAIIVMFEKDGGKYYNINTKGEITPNEYYN